MFEKEATEYATEWGDKTDETYACCRDGYLAGAEFREKRIVELEKENADLKERLFKVDNAYKKKFEAEWRLNDLYQRMREDYANAEKCSREYFILYRTLKDRCIKAEEIIKKFSEFVNNEVEYDSEHSQEHTDLWNELCEQAGQFLKEVFE